VVFSIAFLRFPISVLVTSQFQFWSLPNFSFDHFPISVLVTFQFQFWSLPNFSFDHFPISILITSQFQFWSLPNFTFGHFPISALITSLPVPSGAAEGAEAASLRVLEGHQQRAEGAQSLDGRQR
jgi:hypothetical protein